MIYRARAATAEIAGARRRSIVVRRIACARAGACAHVIVRARATARAAEITGARAHTRAQAIHRSTCTKHRDRRRACARARTCARGRSSVVRARAVARTRASGSTARRGSRAHDPRRTVNRGEPRDPARESFERFTPQISETRIRFLRRRGNRSNSQRKSCELRAKPCGSPLRNLRFLRRVIQRFQALEIWQTVCREIRS